MDPTEATVCRTKIDIAESLLQEVLRSLGETDMTREEHRELTRDVIQATSHLRKAVETMPLSVT